MVRALGLVDRVGVELDREFRTLTKAEANLKSRPVSASRKKGSSRKKSCRMYGMGPVLSHDWYWM